MKNILKTEPETKLISLLLPTDFIPVVDITAARNDTDRSKYIRLAVREKLARDGVVYLPHAATQAA